jgi:hypothetical protein
MRWIQHFLRKRSRKCSPGQIQRFTSQAPRLSLPHPLQECPSGQRLRLGNLGLPETSRPFRDGQEGMPTISPEIHHRRGSPAITDTRLRRCSAQLQYRGHTSRAPSKAYRIPFECPIAHPRAHHLLSTRRLLDMGRVNVSHLLLCNLGNPGLGLPHYLSSRSLRSCLQ